MKRYEVKIISIEGDQPVDICASTAEEAMQEFVRKFGDWFMSQFLTEFDIEAVCGDECEKRSVKVQYSILPFEPEDK